MEIIDRLGITTALVHGPEATMLDCLVLEEHRVTGMRVLTDTDCRRGVFVPVEMALQAAGAIALRGTEHKVVAVLKGDMNVTWHTPALEPSDMLVFGFGSAENLSKQSAIVRGFLGDHVVFELDAGTQIVPASDFNAFVERCRARSRSAHEAETDGHRAAREEREARMRWQFCGQCPVTADAVLDHFYRGYGIAEILPGYALMSNAWEVVRTGMARRGIEVQPYGTCRAKFGVPALLGRTVVTEATVMAGDWDNSHCKGVCSFKSWSDGGTHVTGSFEFREVRVSAAQVALAARELLPAYAEM